MMMMTLVLTQGSDGGATEPGGKGTFKETRGASLVMYAVDITPERLANQVLLARIVREFPFLVTRLMC
jgi:hypothetical protein